jgi:uncharacterized protein YbjT (DUF2867 family)
MSGQTAVVIGATGLIGEQLVKSLLNDGSYSSIRLLVRRPLPDADPRLEIVVVDFQNKIELKNKLGKGDTIFCSIGTTNQKVKGDKVAYRKIDYDIPVNVGKAGIENGFKTYVIVSSVGANERSRNFYLQLKGSVESAIRKLGYKSVHIFRPSFLLGRRKEKRIGEKIMGNIVPVFSFLMVGKLARYKPVAAEVVAKAMVRVSKKTGPGIFVYEYREIVG